MSTQAVTPAGEKHAFLFDAGMDNLRVDTFYVTPECDGIKIDAYAREGRFEDIMHHLSRLNADFAGITYVTDRHTEEALRAVYGFGPNFRVERE